MIFGPLLADLLAYFAGKLFNVLARFLPEDYRFD